MKQGNRIALAAVLVCVFTPGLFASTIFTFSPGDSTPFTYTVNGLDASFSSDGDPGGFYTAYDPFLNPLEVILLDAPSPVDLTLTIDFSAPQTSISIPFGTLSQTGPPAIPFNLTAFNGASQVGSATATGVVPPGVPLAFGGISFSGPAFDSVVLSTAASPVAVYNFWLDGVTVSAAPEPSSLSLVALAGFVGLCVSAITRLRRRGA
jgi:hypothetical protein